MFDKFIFNYSLFNTNTNYNCDFDDPLWYYEEIDYLFFIEIGKKLPSINFGFFSSFFEISLVFWYFFLILFCIVLFLGVSLNFNFFFKVIWKLLQFLFFFFRFIILILFFFFKEHKTWIDIFRRTFDLEYIQMQTRKWFFNWVNWNLLHLEILFCYLRFFRSVYIFVVYFSGYVLDYLFYLKDFIVFMNYGILFRDSFWVSRFFFFFKFILERCLSDVLVFKSWMFFLWFRVYFFVITRLEFNFYFWWWCQRKEIRNINRGFKLDSVDLHKTKYLNLIKPIYKNLNLEKKFNFLYKFKFFLLLYLFNFYKICNLFGFVSYKFLYYLIFCDIYVKFEFVNYLKCRFIILLTFYGQFILIVRDKIFFILHIINIFIVQLLYTLCYVFSKLLNFLYFFKWIYIWVFVLSLLGISFFYEIFTVEFPFILKTFWGYFGETSLLEALNRVYIRERDPFYRNLRRDGYLIHSKYAHHFRHGFSKIVLKLLWLYDYDFTIHSYRAIKQMRDPDGSEGELWRYLAVFHESINWTIRKRAGAFLRRSWFRESEDLQFIWCVQKFYEMCYKTSRKSQLVSWERILKCKFRGLFYKKSVYDRRTFAQIVLGWISADISLKKRWYRRGAFIRPLVYKVRLRLRMLVNDTWRWIFIWRTRLFFYFIFCLLDKISKIILFILMYFYSYRIVKWAFNWVIIMITFIIELVPILIKFIGLFWDYSKRKYGSLLYIHSYWTYLFICIYKTLNYKFYIRTILIYLEFYFDILSIYFLYTFQLIENTYHFQFRSVTWSQVVRSLFVLREYVKSWIDWYYLEYSSYVRRRFNFNLLYMRVLRRKGLYKKRRTIFRKLKRRYLQRAGLAHFLRYSNGIVPELFREALGCKSNAKYFWYFQRPKGANFFYLSRYKLFRAIDWLAINLWIWIGICFICFVGFRKFMYYQHIKDYNGMFYWHKLREHPVEFKQVLQKVNYKAVKAYYFDELDQLRTEYLQFKDESVFKASALPNEEIKKFYKQSVNTILNSVNSSKWRIRQMKKDYLQNWQNLEFFFFSPVTNNFFQTWMTHSVLLEMVISELPALTFNKDVFGLYLNLLWDDDSLETLITPSEVKPFQKLSYNLFWFFYNIDKILYKYKLPAWGWHKSHFFSYYLQYPGSKSFLSVSFDDVVRSGSMTGFVIWIFFIPFLFVHFIRFRLGMKGYKRMFWGVRFFYFDFWYHLDFLTDWVHMLARAYFNTKAFMSWRGRWSSKDGIIRRRRRARYKRRFYWHYLKRCYPNLMFIKHYVFSTSWKFFDWLLFKRGSIGLSFYEFKLLLLIIKIFLIGFIFWSVWFLVWYVKKGKLQFKNKIMSVGIEELILYSSILDTHLRQKAMLRRVCRYYGFGR